MSHTKQYALPCPTHLPSGALVNPPSFPSMDLSGSSAVGEGSATALLKPGWKA